MTQLRRYFIAVALLCCSVASSFEGLESNKSPFTSAPQKSAFHIKRQSIARREDLHETTIDLVSTVLASTIPTAFATDISKTCSQDSQYYLEALLQKDTWALQMFESNGHYPEGLIGGGNYHAVGLFDECIKSHDDKSISGQYCTVFFKTAAVQADDLTETSPRANEWLTILQIFQQLNNNTTQLKEPKTGDFTEGDSYFPSTGLCLPSSCTSEDVRKSVAQLVGSFTITPNTSIVTIGDESYCYTEEKVSSAPDFTAGDITMITLLSLLGFLLIAATAYDAWRTHYRKQPIDGKTEGKLIASFHCFSAIKNSETLLSTRSTVGPDSIDCLNGIRVFATTWVVLGHAWRFPLKHTNFVYNIKMSQEDVYSDWMLQTVLNNSVAVDSFFLMSAMLVTGSLLREFDRNKGSFNAVLFYVHRYLRLTAVYAIILGFIATLYAYLGTGPNWHEVEMHSEACQVNWWQNMLYINNFFYSLGNAMCMGESWYLAVDMQLFIITPLLIYPLWKWPKAGLAWIGLLFVASISATIVVFILWDIPPTLLSTMPPTRYDSNYYALPWFRCPSYLIGIIFGWFLHQIKGSLVTLKKSVVAGGWLVATLICLLVVYGLIPYMDERIPVPDVARVFYAAFHRPAWTIATAWVIFACLKGYGGIVNKFLSSGAFIVLGRTTYVVYLVHLNVIALFYGHLRKPFYYTVFSQVMLYLAFVFLSFLVAFIICLTIEQPLLGLERLHIVSKRKSSTNNPGTNGVNNSKTQSSA